MLLNPIKLIKDAVKIVPSLKYIWGLIAALAVISLIKLLNIEYKTALIGVPIIFILAIIVIVFAKIATNADETFKKPSLILLWSSTILFLISCCFLLTSLFFNFPLRLGNNLNPIQDVQNEIAKPNDYLSNPTLRNILISVFDETPPAQRDLKSQFYYGLKVKWDLEFYGINEVVTKNNIQFISITCCEPMSNKPLVMGTVIFYVPLENYQYVKVLKKYSKLRVFGTIVGIDTQVHTIILDGIKMELLNPKSALQ